MTKIKSENMISGDEMNTCQNPFKIRSRKHNEIELEILFKGVLLGICRNCWRRLEKSNQEWSSEQK